MALVMQLPPLTNCYSSMLLMSLVYVCWCVAAGKKSSKRKEDTFGMNDDDWNVYRTIVSVLVL